MRPIPHTLRNSDRRVRGNVTIIVTIALTTMFGLLGLVFDVGYGYYIKQIAQGAADSAALAAVAAAKPTGSASLSCSTSVLCQTSYICPASPANTTNFGSACLYAKQNGFNTGGSQTVTVSGGTGNPPNVSGMKNATYWVQVEAKQTTRTTFLNFLDASSMDVRALSTAVLTGMGDQFCIYVMDPFAANAMTLGGSADVESSCGVYVNSNSATALIASGSSQLNTTATDIVGGMTAGGSAQFTPTPTLGVSPAADPLATLPAPTFSGCDHTSTSIQGGTVTLNPGVYCSGINIKNATVNFNPGTYILNGGGLTIAGSANVYGSNVMFYNTASGYTFGPILVAGGTRTSLTAPASGTYQGVLFFQDRTITSTVQNTISGGSELFVSGTFYMPTGMLSFSGGSNTTPLVSAIICRTLSISGGAFLEIDPTGEKTGIGKINAALM